MSSNPEPVGSVPENANTHCVGTESELAGKAASCEGCPNQAACASAPKGPDPDLEDIAERLRPVKHIILVLSGKGGVGKSTVASQLAFALAEQGRDVGLLDIDICGPSLPKMLGLEGQEIHSSGTGWSPVYLDDNLGVMSIGFMLPNPDDAVIWRGPRKNGLIKQFLKDVDWGPIDYLIVDAPPGTSDEHISIAQYLTAAHMDGAVVVTTPQQVAIIDVRKEINFCKKVGLPVLGVLENMASLSQPLRSLKFCLGDEDVTATVLEAIKTSFPDKLADVMASLEVFPATGGGAEAMAAEMGVPFLGRVPLDPALAVASESGVSVFNEATGAAAAAAPAIKAIVESLVQKVERMPHKEGPSGGAAPGDLAIDPLLTSRIHLGF